MDQRRRTVPHHAGDVDGSVEHSLAGTPARQRAVGDANRNGGQRVEGDGGELASGDGVDQRRLPRFHLAVHRDPHAPLGELGEHGVEIGDRTARKQLAVRLESLASFVEGLAQSRRQHSVRTRNLELLVLHVSVRHHDPRPDSGSGVLIREGGSGSKGREEVRGVRFEV